MCNIYHAYEFKKSSAVFHFLFSRLKMMNWYFSCYWLDIWMVHLFFCLQQGKRKLPWESKRYMLTQKLLYLTLCVSLQWIEDAMSNFLKIKESTSNNDQQSSLWVDKEAFIHCSIPRSIFLSIFTVFYLHNFLSHI